MVVALHQMERDGPSMKPHVPEPRTIEVEGLLALGARVEIHSLRQSPELNGVRGEVVEFSAVSRRSPMGGSGRSGLPI